MNTETMKSFMLGILAGIIMMTAVVFIFGNDSVYYHNGEMAIKKQAFKAHHMIKEVDEHDNVIYKWATTNTVAFR